MFQPLDIVTGSGAHHFDVEIANNDASREQGLMFRAFMPPDRGMLFEFDRNEPVSFWMKNTVIPLSVAFIDAKGQIVSIHEMLPHTDNPHCAASPARYALEMNAGWFRAKGIQRGIRISGVEKAPGPQ